VIDRLNPLKGEKLILLADPRRMIRVGGVLPKLQAAIDAGCTEVIMPKENERDVQMTPDYVRDKLEVRFVTSIEEVLEAALLKAS
jgi:ATP-dependent Lon protease